MGNKFREKPAAEEPKVKVEEPVVETPAPEPAAAEAPEPRRDGRAAKAARGIGRVLGGDILADQMVLKQIPLLLLFLGCLLVVIANRYNVEKISRDKQETEVRINFLREHRIQMQKQYQQSIKISQIAEDLQEMGVGITAGPPYEIEK